MQGLKKINQENISLVFLDWEMPNLTGIQILQAVRFGFFKAEAMS